jgi:hypothetical protein
VINPKVCLSRCQSAPGILDDLGTELQGKSLLNLQAAVGAAQSPYFSGVVNHTARPGELGGRKSQLVTSQLVLIQLARGDTSRVIATLFFDKTQGRVNGFLGRFNRKLRLIYLE